MLLTIDVGNTNTVMGVYKGETLKADWRIRSDRERTADEYGMLLHELMQAAQLPLEEIHGVVLGSVVPPMMREMVTFIQKYLKQDPLIVGEPNCKLDIKIQYESLSEIGPDRLIDALAAYRLYGGPAIIVDFGTATTFDVIDKDGAYLGGAIAPGIGISTEALFTAAARLPRIDLIRPSHVIGKNTVESMQAGIVLGFVGQVDELVRRIQLELETTTQVVATGGLAELIGKESRSIQKINKLLTLEGLRMIWEMNRQEI